MRRWMIAIAVVVFAGGAAAYAWLGRDGEVRRPSIVLVGSGTYRAAIECEEGFERGCDERYPYTAGPGKPRWRVIVWLDAFWADAGLVRREAYEACRRAGACKGPQEPPDEFQRCNANSFASVAFADARAYCAWRGWRLPTADEFERMARWTDGRRYAGGHDDVPGGDCDHRVSPDGIRGLNQFRQWVESPTGESGVQGGVAVSRMPEGSFPFRCVRSFKSGPNPGKAVVWPQQDDPWLEGGPDW